MNKNDISHDHLKPMNIGQAAVYFASFSLFIAVFVHILLPVGMNNGVPQWLIYYTGVSLPMLMGVLLSVFLYKSEMRRGICKSTFSERFRIKPLTGKDWLWTVGLILFWFITFMLINGLIKNVLPRPSYLLYPEGTHYGLPIAGNYLLAGWMIIFLFLNIAGEELFWRGYMLPRLEVKYGGKAWLVNGILWSLFHLPMYFLMPAIAPGCIMLAYVVQKRKNTSIGMIGHLALNSVDIIVLVLAVFGL